MGGCKSCARRPKWLKKIEDRLYGQSMNVVPGTLFVNNTWLGLELWNVMAEFYEYCLPPGVHTMRLRYFDRPFYHKNEAQIFQVYHGRVNSSPFLASLVLFQFILPLLCWSTLSRGHFEVKAIFDNAKMTPPCVAGAFVSRENKQWSCGELEL